MTRDEQKALRLVEGALELLRNAISEGDPLRELDLRARGLLADMRAITAGKSRAVAMFPKITK